MAARTVKRLFDLEIDEISLVDRSANQHADVAIAKRDEGTMTLMDVDGYEVDASELEPGEAVLDVDTGEVHVACEEGMSPEDYYGDEDPAAQFEDVEVGKGMTGFKQGFRLARGAGKGQVDAAERTAASRIGGRSGRLGQKAGDMTNAMGSMKGGEHVIRNGKRYGYGAAGVGAAGTGYAVAKNQSLGESVYEELSKALGSDARDEVISKALQDAQEQTLIAQRSAEQAWNIAKSLQDQAEVDEYLEIAKGYGLPGDPAEIAMILKNTADTQGFEAVEKMHQLFSSTGEQLFAETGSSLGALDSSVQAQIEAMANEAVSKSDMSPEQAIVALYSANEDAYDAYLAETR